MGKAKKDSRPGHTKQKQAEATRERVMVYRDGKLRFEWRDK